MKTVQNKKFLGEGLALGAKQETLAYSQPRHNSFFYYIKQSPVARSVAGRNSSSKPEVYKSPTNVIEPTQQDLSPQKSEDLEES